jgi:hypothetical protein
MVWIRVLFIFFTILFMQSACHEADAGSFGFGVHSGLGAIKFREKENFRGSNFQSESRQPALLFGGSGEYSFQRPKNIFAGITTDWALGLKDEETWTQDGVQVQTNDMRFFGQFYDLRVGYKNSSDNLYYRLYVSGGWDGLRFKRDNVIWQGNPLTTDSREDIRLWRTGIGTGFGYRLEKWALDARAAYSYYPFGETEDSSLPETTFDTHGTCLDFGLGVARKITGHMNVYIGSSYTLQKLRGDINNDNPLQTISWKSTLEIFVAMANLTYAF